ncbi:gliding motility-associated C-terminal domain-containing protein [Agriterribacter sp.]|uniref:T9SS type B sorting domain-containing protein n=1 Tax=Agriterribacter sp. TaxID=2821509 RepID=UPI002C0FF1A6|nr:gliding motility-associated C-terminal domain-containing protein [Agriterribacter sp.]HRO45953.1 gliding motility-associated C-terminal domain-containing protein [Agriterribacter sp.]HRQ19405.1 gliding motility-associated C-terminal domain-containing protein [Agriterribacter sp.]
MTASSQLPLLNWVKAFEAYNAGNSNARTVGIDEQGNVYSAGWFENSVDFDPGSGVYMMTGGSQFQSGVYISKLDANGNFVWAKQIPALLEFSQVELKVDRTGNVYLASDSRGAADMDPGPGVHMMTPTGFRDVFVVKLNTDGNFVWAKQFGGPGDTGPQSYMIELDPDNNVIVGGAFNNTVDFDPGPGTLNLTSSAHFQAFIVKLSNDGELIWAKQFGNGPEVYSGCNITDIKCDAQGNIVIVGSFARTCDFDPGPGVYNVTSVAGNSSNGFICKLDASSNFVWVKTLQEKRGDNNYFITPTGIDIDGMNNILTTGFFIGDFDFDPGAGEQNFFSNPHDCYILKLDQQGNFVWAKIIGNSESDMGSDVAVDAANNVYIIGSFGTSVDFDPGPGVHFINSPHYGLSALIKLSSGGEFVYAAPFQSISYGTSLFRRMIMDADHHIYVTGTAYGVNDFDPGPGVFSFTGGPFVLKLGPCLNATSSTLNISTCNSYTLNNQTFDSTGTYLQTILNVSGCDSLITLNLTINKKLTEQTKTICDGEFFFAGGANQIISGIYYDTLRTVLGCDSVIATHLTVNPKPSLNLGTDKNLCRNTQLTLTPGAYTSYLWQDSSNAATLTINSTGLYWVRVTNIFSCEATDTIMVLDIIEPPTGFLRKTDSVCSYKSLELAPSGSYTSYQWSTGQATKNIQVQTPGTYWLTVTDANRCIGVDTTIVFAKQCMFGVYVPTAFTPDNNGKNDKFKPIVYGKTVHYHLLVYNRWGSLVFQTTDPEKGWDGTIGGVSQNTGLFVWVCSYQLEGAEPGTEKGTVLLIR